MLTLFQNALSNQLRVAIRQGEMTWTYADLLAASGQMATILLGRKPDLKGERIAFMVKPGFHYVSTLWAIWRAGGVAVPLCLDHPRPALQYVVEDTGASILIASEEMAQNLIAISEEKKIPILVLEKIMSTSAPQSQLPDIELNRRAMILYTSGTTNKPKGVVTTHLNIEAQIRSLVEAWRWSGEDQTLCVLPLHHVHGIINVISCALWSGACCEFLTGSFSAEAVFSVFKQGNINVFMAVPTIYYKLIQSWEQMNLSDQQRLSSLMSKFRLMVSGSAALPVSVMEKWHEISHQRLLERYGMTELGMVISNPYEGERRPGHIGQPLPGVQVRLCNEKDEIVRNEPGEIQVKGPNVFLEYWRNKETTEKSFTVDGWFRTGDIAEVHGGYYKILGRNSVDIIKSGGYKISALEIEEAIRLFPHVDDCSVVGIENEEWGEIVAAAVVSDEPLDDRALSAWLAERIPRYKVPRKFIQLEALPRNAMGKVIKNDLKTYFKQ